MAAESVTASQLYPDVPQPVYAWHNDALLWHLQLGDEGWDSLMAALAIERIGTPQRQVSAIPLQPIRLSDASDRDIRITLDDGTSETPSADPFWSWDIATPPEHALCAKIE